MQKAIANIRKNIVRMAHYSHASHVGSALSVVDILYIIYSKLVKINTNRDKVILSKGHAGTAIYSTLVQMGLLDKENLKKYNVDGCTLPGHLDKETCAAIDCSAGSLGHGLPIAMAVADKFSHYVGSQSYIKKCMGFSGLKQQIEEFFK